MSLLVNQTNVNTSTSFFAPAGGGGGGGFGELIGVDIPVDDNISIVAGATEQIASITIPIAVSDTNTSFNFSTTINFNNTTEVFTNNIRFYAILTINGYSYISNAWVYVNQAKLYVVTLNLIASKFNPTDQTTSNASISINMINEDIENTINGTASFSNSYFYKISSGFDGTFV